MIGCRGQKSLLKRWRVWDAESHSGPPFSQIHSWFVQLDGWECLLDNKFNTSVLTFMQSIRARIIIYIYTKY